MLASDLPQNGRTALWLQRHNYLVSSWTSTRSSVGSWHA